MFQGIPEGFMGVPGVSGIQEVFKGFKRRSKESHWRFILIHEVLVAIQRCFMRLQGVSVDS